jgi:hypothetical protein
MKHRRFFSGPRAKAQPRQAAREPLSRTEYERRQLLKRIFRPRPQPEETTEHEDSL